MLCGNNEFSYQFLLVLPCHLLHAYIYTPNVTARLYDNRDYFNFPIVNFSLIQLFVPFVIITIQSFPHSWFIAGFVTRVTRCEAGIAYPFGTPGFTQVFGEGRFARSLVFCVMLCRSFVVLYLLAIVLFILRFTATFLNLWI